MNEKNWKVGGHGYALLDGGVKSLELPKQW